MQQPQGYTVGRKPGQVLLFMKAIYGLKQSGRAWNNKLDCVLRSIGFDPWQYIMSGKGNLAIILVYVDDFIIACQNKADLINIKASISNAFECVDNGPLKLFLGMEIERDGELSHITLGQTLYILKLLRKHCITDCRPADRT